MMTSNNALIPDPDKEDILASKPFDWPWAHLGLRMCGWGDNQTKYYLIGTPVIWWAGAASLVITVLSFAIYLLRMQRKYADFERGGGFLSQDKFTGRINVDINQVNGNICFMWAKLPLVAGVYTLVSILT
jgi:dolichyl-phosphate-mannose--protein O-mannosyl transferase